MTRLAYCALLRPLALVSGVTGGIAALGFASG